MRSSSQIECVQPALRAANYSVDVVSVEVDLGPSLGSAWYSVYDHGLVTAAMPSVGVPNSAFLVHVHGDRLPNISLICYFARTKVTATFLNSSCVACTSPLVPDTLLGESGTLVVSVRLARAEGGVLDGEGLITFFSEMDVTSVSPSTIPSTGGTRLTVTGAHFSDRSDLACLFSPEESPVQRVFDSDFTNASVSSGSRVFPGSGVLGGTVRVEATRLSSTTMVCLAPSLPLAPARIALRVECLRQVHPQTLLSRIPKPHTPYRQPYTQTPNSKPQTPNVMDRFRNPRPGSRCTGCPRWRGFARVCCPTLGGGRSQ